MCKCRGEIGDIDLNIYLYFSLKKSSRCSTAGRGNVINICIGLFYPVVTIPITYRWWPSGRFRCRTRVLPNVHF